MNANEVLMHGWTVGAFYKQAATSSFQTGPNVQCAPIMVSKAPLALLDDIPAEAVWPPNSLYPKAFAPDINPPFGA